MNIYTKNKKLLIIVAWAIILLIFNKDYLFADKEKAMVKTEINCNNIK